MSELQVLLDAAVRSAQNGKIAFFTAPIPNSADVLAEARNIIKSEGMCIAAAEGNLAIIMRTPVKRYVAGWETAVRRMLLGEEKRDQSFSVALAPYNLVTTYWKTFLDIHPWLSAVPGNVSKLRSGYESQFFAVQITPEIETPLTAIPTFVESLVSVEAFIAALSNIESSAVSGVTVEVRVCTDTALRERILLILDALAWLHHASAKISEDGLTLAVTTLACDADRVAEIVLNSGVSINKSASQDQRESVYFNTTATTTFNTTATKDPNFDHEMQSIVESMSPLGKVFVESTLSAYKCSDASRWLRTHKHNMVTVVKDDSNLLFCLDEPQVWNAVRAELNRMVDDKVACNPMCIQTLVHRQDHNNLRSKTINVAKSNDLALEIAVESLPSGHQLHVMRVTPKSSKGNNASRHQSRVDKNDRVRSREAVAMDMSSTLPNVPCDLYEHIRASQASLPPGWELRSASPDITDDVMILVNHLSRKAFRLSIDDFVNGTYRHTFDELATSVTTASAWVGA